MKAVATAGRRVDVQVFPDFRKESVRRKYAKDDWSPDPARAGKGQPPCSILGDIEPSVEARALARKVWAERGYHGE